MARRGNRCNVSVQATVAASSQRVPADSAATASRRSRASAAAAWHGASSSRATGKVARSGGSRCTSSSGAELRSTRRGASRAAAATCGWIVQSLSTDCLQRQSSFKGALTWCDTASSRAARRSSARWPSAAADSKACRTISAQHCRGSQAQASGWGGSILLAALLVGTCCGASESCSGRQQSSGGAAAGFSQSRGPCCRASCLPEASLGVPASPQAGQSRCGANP